MKGKRPRYSFRGTTKSRLISLICHLHALYWYSECIAAEPVRSPAACRCWAFTWEMTF